MQAVTLSIANFLLVCPINLSGLKKPNHYLQIKHREEYETYLPTPGANLGIPLRGPTNKSVPNTKCPTQMGSIYHMRLNQLQAHALDYHPLNGFFTIYIFNKTGLSYLIRHLGGCGRLLGHH